MNKKEILFVFLYLCSWNHFICPMGGPLRKPEEPIIYKILKDFLVNAIIKNNIQHVKQLLENVENINMKLKDDETLLHVAVKNKRLEIAELLLKKGIDVNAKNTYNVAPIHYMAKNKNMFAMIELLIKHNANMEEILSGDNLRPIHIKEIP